jgi:hypothetical protein
MRIARCSCGQLTAACEGEPVRVSVCHCVECQRRTGSAFGVAAFFPIEAAITAGRSATYERTGDSGGTLRFHFCPTCGSTVHWVRSAKPELIGVAVGAFADQDLPPPDREVYQERGHPWAKLNLGIQE